MPGPGSQPCEFCWGYPALADTHAVERKIPPALRLSWMLDQQHGSYALCFRHVPATEFDMFISISKVLTYECQSSLQELWKPRFLFWKQPLNKPGVSRVLFQLHLADGVWHGATIVEKCMLTALTSSQPCTFQPHLALSLQAPCCQIQKHPSFC